MAFTVKLFLRRLPPHPYDASDQYLQMRGVQPAFAHVTIVHLKELRDGCNHSKAAGYRGGLKIDTSSIVRRAVADCAARNLKWMDIPKWRDAALQRTPGAYKKAGVTSSCVPRAQTIFQGTYIGRECTFFRICARKSNLDLICHARISNSFRSFLLSQ